MKSLYLSRANKVPDGNCLLYAFKIFDKDKKSKVKLSFLRWSLATQSDRVDPNYFNDLARDLCKDPDTDWVDYHQFVKLCVGPDELPRFIVQRSPTELHADVESIESRMHD